MHLDHLLTGVGTGTRLQPGGLENTWPSWLENGWQQSRQKCLCPLPPGTRIAPRTSGGRSGPTSPARLPGEGCTRRERPKHEALFSKVEDHSDPCTRQQKPGGGQGLCGGDHGAISPAGRRGGGSGARAGWGTGSADLSAHWLLTLNIAIALRGHMWATGVWTELAAERRTVRLQLSFWAVLVAWIRFSKDVWAKAHR